MRIPCGHFSIISDLSRLWRSPSSFTQRSQVNCTRSVISPSGRQPGSTKPGKNTPSWNDGYGNSVLGTRAPQASSLLRTKKTKRESNKQESAILREQGGGSRIKTSNYWLLLNDL